MMRYDAIAIGGSSGAFDVIGKVLHALPAAFSLPLLITLHVSHDSESLWIGQFAKKSKLTVKEAEDKEPIQKGFAYIAPPGYHLLVEADQSLSLSSDDRVNFARPSIDVMFESAAISIGNKLVGILLTGANRDGAAGLRRIKEMGGMTIVQDPATAHAREMPAAAIKESTPDLVLSPEAIIKTLLALVK